MVNSTNHKTVFYNPLKFFLFISLLLINAFFFTSSAFPGELKKALQITIAKADPDKKTDKVDESLKIRFDPERRIMNVGAEEAVTLHLEGGGIESYTVTLNSSHPDIVSPVSTSVTFSGASKRVSVKVKAVKEGSATITAIASRGPPPTKKWGTEKLPASGRTLKPLTDEIQILGGLEKDYGFKTEHARRMHEFAQEKNVFLIVRDGNPDSVKYFDEKKYPNYMPKPMSAKAKTATVGPNKGLVVDPTHDKQKEYWQDARDRAKQEWKGATDNAEREEKKKYHEWLENKYKKALKAWKDYGDKMKSNGYQVNDDTGVIEKVETLKDGSTKVWEGIHGDYDLHGVYRQRDDGTIKHVSYGTGQKGDETGKVLRKQLNNKLTEKGKDFIQHGSQDDWIPDEGLVKKPDPPVTVFFPDGSDPLHLKTADQMREFYENKMGVPWPYQTPDGDKRDGDDDNGTRTAKGELSIKVIDLEKALKPLLKRKPKRLDLPDNRELKKLEALPKDFNRHPQKPGYTGLYLDAAYKKAAEELDLDKNELPKEGYALLTSGEVFEAIYKDEERGEGRDERFADKLREIIGDNGDNGDNIFKIFTRETWTGEEVEEKIGDIRKLKAEIIKEYKKKEKEVINKAFREFVAVVVEGNPDMEERLISVQALYDLYENKKKEAKVKFGPYIKNLIQAKELVNAAVHLYNEGPKAVFKLILIRIAKQQCYKVIELMDDTVVVAGATHGGPIGAFAAYVAKKAVDYMVCDLLIDEFFREGVKAKYSKDREVNDHVKIFYTGEGVEGNKLPSDVNFYSSFGGSREEILDKIRSPELLNEELKKHLTNLWNKYPDLRKYLDIKGDNRSNDIVWDDYYKGKEIWRAILETANRDMIRAFEKKLEQVEVTKSPMDIERYFTRDSESEDIESMMIWKRKSYVPMVYAELPSIKIDGEEIPKEVSTEVSIKKTLNMKIRFMVLGFAGHDETINIHWTVPTGWLSSIDQNKDVPVEFPEQEVKNVKKHIKIKENTFDLKIDKNTFIPGSSYRVKVTLKYLETVLYEFIIPFKVKSEEPEQPEEEQPDEPVEPDEPEEPDEPDEDKEKEKCEGAKEKVNEIESDVETITSGLDRINEEIEDIKEKQKVIEVKAKEAKRHADDAYKASLEVIEAKPQMEGLALSVCKKAEKILKAKSKEEVERLSDQMDKEYKEVRKLKDKARKALEKAGKEAEKAEKIFEKYKSLIEEIGKLKEKVEKHSSTLESVRKALEQAGESIGREATPSGQSQSSEAEDKDDCMEAVNKTIDSKEEELTNTEDDLKKMMNELTVSKSVKEWLDKMKKAAKDARASVDVAEVYYEGLEQLASDAGKCVAAVGRLPMKAYFIISIEGSGPLQKFTVLIQSGMSEEILPLERAQDLRTALKAKRDGLLDYDICERLNADIFPPKLPGIWNSGPKVTVVDGPFLSESEFSGRKLKDTWRTTDDDGPSLDGLREQCK